jgi:prepilin-type N-terminal cleavage/methylation domain-containing protein
MKRELQIRYLQHLLKHEQRQQGFTLIELLVVMIIVAALAAIMAPTLMANIARSRSAEALSNVSAINRAQQVIYHAKTTFTNNLADIETRVTGEYYTYTIDTPNDGYFTVNSVNLQNELLGVSGAGVMDANLNYDSVICVSKAKLANGAGAAVPPAALTCPASYTEMK